MPRLKEASRKGVAVAAPWTLQVRQAQSSPQGYQEHYRGSHQSPCA